MKLRPVPSLVGECSAPPERAGVGGRGGCRFESGDTQALKDMNAHKDDLHSGKKLCLHVYLLLRYFNSLH